MFGYLGLFLVVALWGIVALIATLFYPKSPSPDTISAKDKNGVQKAYERAPENEELETGVTI